ncbi:hypothetical protein [Leucobacter soli]|uniref:hypothetical protein n=1 Tax=Leucobacter soli TaxID=2812850 RepID=UPI0036184274
MASANAYMVPLPAPRKMAAAVNAMTALGAMLARACAASSGPDMTPSRRPLSTFVSTV